MSSFIILGLISIIHAFKVRGEYLTLITELKKIKSEQKQRKLKSKGILNTDGGWDKKGDHGLSNRQVYLLGGAFFLILLIVVSGLSQIPEISKLSMNTVNAQIDDKTTEYVITGTSEPNAIVNITEPNLNLNNAQAQVDSSGKFEYKLQIPLQITSLNVTVNAQAINKTSTTRNIIIDRPVTSLTIEPVPNLDEKTTTATITGKTESNATLILNSAELKITNLNITADSNGNIKYSLNIPLNVTSTSLSIDAQATGRKPVTNTITINRTITPPTPTTTTPTTTQSTSSAEDFDNGYTSGESWALIALNENYNKYAYLPGDFGGTYPDVVKDKSSEFKNGYEAGYMDYLKSVGEYP